MTSVSNIKHYVDSICEEAKASILNDFDISNLNDFNPFDYINFHIINKHILEDSLEDLYIGIPEDDFSDNFFQSVFYSVALIKLFQNFCAYKLKNPELIAGDIIYTKEQIFTYKGEIANKLKVKPLFPKPNQKGCDYVEIPKGIYTKLNKDFDYKKSKTITLLKEFSKFLKEKFKDKNFPFLSQFPHKALVIADQKYFNVNHNLPTRYWTKTGNQKHQIPLEILMEICNDFNTADAYLLNEKTFDQLIVIADNKYADNDIFSKIQNAKWSGKIQQIILIGSTKPSLYHCFKEWPWCKAEIKIANGEELKELKKININDQKLLSIVEDLKREIDTLHFAYGIDVSYFLRYINFFLRLVLTDTKNAIAVLMEYTDRIESHFQSDEFRNRFYERNIYDLKIINDVSEFLRIAFKKLEFHFLQDNLKWAKIVELSNLNKKIYLIIEKRYYDYLKLQLTGFNNIFLIADKRVDSEIDYLDKWINSERNNTIEKIYIVPYLNNQEIFDKLKSIQGKCFCLCYQEIDELAFDKLHIREQEENYSKINHPDRKKFTHTNFILKTPQTNNKLESIFDINLLSERGKLSLEENFDALRDDIFYEIFFEDSSNDIFKSSKAVFLVDGNEQIRTTFGEVYENALVRFYRNDNPETFNQFLSIFDSNNQMEIINEMTRAWRVALRKLQEAFPNNIQLFANLFKNKVHVQYNTFLNYFDEKSTVRFPRKSTMEALKDLCLESGITEIEFVKNYDLVTRFSKEDKRIRQQAGKILGSDLIDYVASGFSEKSESLKKIPKEILENLEKSIVEKKVERKRILKNDDERLFRQSTIDFS